MRPLAGSLAGPCGRNLFVWPVVKTRERGKLGRWVTGKGVLAGGVAAKPSAGSRPCSPTIQVATGERAWPRWPRNSVGRAQGIFGRPLPPTHREHAHLQAQCDSGNHVFCPAVTCQESVAATGSALVEVQYSELHSVAASSRPDAPTRWREVYLTPLAPNSPRLKIR